MGWCAGRCIAVCTALRFGLRDASPGLLSPGFHLGPGGLGSHSLVMWGRIPRSEGRSFYGLHLLYIGSGIISDRAGFDLDLAAYGVAIAIGTDLILVAGATPGVLSRSCQMRALMVPDRSIRRF